MRYSLNGYLRRGFERARLLAPRKRFVVKARALGRWPGLNYDKLGELAERIEDPLVR